MGSLKCFYYTVVVLLFFTAYLYCDDIDISIAQESGGFQINATFYTDAPAEKVREVLVDYENIPNFASSIVKSKIKTRENGFIFLEQIGKQNILPLFSVKVYLLLKVEESKNRINFEDTSKKDFELYIGYWEINEISSGTVASYSLTVKPNFYIPDFIAKKIFINKSKKMCREILDEINRRKKESR